MEFAPSVLVTDKAEAISNGFQAVLGENEIQLLVSYYNFEWTQFRLSNFVSQFFLSQVSIFFNVHII